MKKKVKKVTTVTEEIIEIDDMKKDVSHIVCVLDRSGSMNMIIDDMIGGFNSFIEEQKKLDDECYLTVVLFDNEYQVLHEMVNVKNVKPITKSEWVPRGTTALYDAIGKSIDDVLKQDKVSTKKLMCIVTDGYENASEKYSSKQIKSMINDLEKKSWTFIYLGANQDAFAVGNNIGISSGNILNYQTTSTSVYYSNDVLTNSATKFRSATVGTNYNSLVSDAENDLNT